MRKTLLDILNDVKSGMEIVMLIMKISDEFDITISPLDIVPENFESLDAILKLINKIQEE